MSATARNARLIEHVQRPQPIARRSFDAFAVVDGQSALGQLRSFGDVADTLDDCLSTATLRTPHKGQFIVRETDHIDGRVTLRLYAKRRKSRGERRYSDYETRTIHDEYAELVVTLDGAAMTAIAEGNPDAR